MLVIQLAKLLINELIIKFVNESAEWKWTSPGRYVKIKTIHAERGGSMRTGCLMPFEKQLVLPCHDPVGTARRLQAWNHGKTARGRGAKPAAGRRGTGMTLTQLRYFLATCKHGNMTRAATELKVSQPSITGAIKDLEREFDVVLFTRHKTRLTLTKEGSTLYYAAKEVLEKVGELQGSMKALGEQKKAINIGVSALSYYLFPDLFSSFHQKWPEVDLNTYNFGASELERYVASGALHVAVSARPSDLSLHRRPLLSGELYLWTHRSNPLAQKGSIDLSSADLAHEPLAIYRESSLDEEDFDAMLRDTVLNADAHNVIFCSNQVENIRNCLLERRASTFLIKGIFDQEEELVGIPIVQGLTTELYIYWDGVSCDESVLEFIRYTEEYARRRYPPVS